MGTGVPVPGMAAEEVAPAMIGGILKTCNGVRTWCEYIIIFELWVLAVWIMGQHGGFA